jgi:outer membrane protein assembly factor BamB
MPVVVGDRVFATAHPHSLVCLDKASGRVVWIRQVSPYDAATAEERSAKPEAFTRLDALAAKRKAYYDAFIAGEAPGEAQVKEEAALEDLMDKTMLEVDPEKYKRPDEQGEPDWWLVPTPVSDGSGIYLASTRGTCAGFALDGTRRWIRYQRPLNQHHGFFASPVIADGKLIALDGTLTAYDTASGATAWSLDLVKDKIKGYLWFGSLLRGDLGGTSYVLCPNGTTLVRARDGRVTGGPSLISSTTTPVFDGTTSWQLAEVSLLAHPLAATADGVAVGKPRHLPAEESERLGSGSETVSIGGIIRRQFAKSPLVHDGLVYALTNHGELLVMEADTGRLAYRTLLPLELWNGSRRVGYHFSVANLAMAGGPLLVCGASGQTLVIKAGRTYQEVARNRIQNLARSGRVLGNYGYASTNRPLCPDYFDGTANTTPVFDGPRILLRSDESIYCIQAAGD